MAPKHKSNLQRRHRLMIGLVTAMPVLNLDCLKVFLDSEPHYSDHDIRLILGGNVKRVLADIWAG